MQTARYYISYDLLKAAESVLGAVACCSGCFRGLSQRGRRARPGGRGNARRSSASGAPTATTGHSRTRILRTGSREPGYHARSRVWTNVPSDYVTFFREQLRWKKSWIREGLLLLRHIWHTHPLAFPPILVATMDGLLSPLIVFRKLCWLPNEGTLSIVYAMALYLVSDGIQPLLCAVHAKMGSGSPPALTRCSALVFSAQLLWAIARIRDGSWGTRRA